MLAFKDGYPVDKPFTVTVKGDVAGTDITTTFDLTIWQADTYEFKITEKIDDVPDGWRFSTSEIIVKIVVEAQKDGSLKVADVKYNDQGAVLEFINSYCGETSFYANKTWTKYNGEEDIALKLYYQEVLGLDDEGNLQYSE